MKKEVIRKRFIRKGYKVQVSFTGNVIITPAGRVSDMFSSLNAAYRHYFM